MWITQKDPKAAAEHFRRAVQIQGKHHQHITTIIYTLGGIYNKLGYPEQEQSLYEQAVQQGVFLDVQQRPLLLLRSITPSVPFPKEKKTLSALQLAFDRLEAGCKAIQEELLGLTGPTLYQDNEQLEASGHWRQIVLMRNGAKSVENWVKYTKTVDVIEPIVEKLAKNMPKASVELSIMEPGTHVRPHCGPSNHRLRIHLGLVIPEGAEMRVANETTGWEECKVMVFDDSFEHEVFHNGTKRRVVLMLDVWHPALDENEKQYVRQYFRWTPHSVMTPKVPH
eukprot:TRINITY_DN67570_c11_g1_i1.p1 TRINITY_DN67570_c11_g1~~TRINITY_DN67570_c11_g1_i1.p1  ORF type:complete len:327 (+),score=24.10 TRINITY_DN67570_c11_g1_i1:139-981(+)